MPVESADQNPDHHNAARQSPAGPRQFAQRIGEGARFRTEHTVQAVLDQCAQPHGDQQWQQHARAQGSRKDPLLQQHAASAHHRNCHHDGQPGRPAQADQPQHQESADHGQVTMRQVDDAHDAEHQRKPGCQHGVVAPQQGALNECVDHVVCSMPK